MNRRCPCVRWRAIPSVIWRSSVRRRRAWTPSRSVTRTPCAWANWCWRSAIRGVGGAAVEGQVPLPEAIRADVRLAPGNSGGPLADAEGRVIGINAMIAGGMAVAVPSNTASRFAAGDAPGQGFLGIAAVPVPLPPAIAASYGAPDGFGLLLTDIAGDSPAARAGLLPGDLLFGLDDARGGRAVA